MEKVYQQMDVRWTKEEREIFQKAIDLCWRCAEDEQMEDWAQDRCRESFVDVANYLQDYLNNSL